MIEKRIKNEETLKKWRIFKSHKRAYVSSWFLLFFLFFSLTAEFWSNSVPLYISYQGKSYFPFAKEYSVSEFNINDSMRVDYRNLELSDGDFAIWPIIRWDPYESNREVESYPSKPTTLNLFGTDDRGRDVLTRILYGFRYSFTFAFLVWLFCYVIGTILGGVMGFYGGRVDFLGQRVVELLSTVPVFFLLLILISIFTPSLLMLVVINSLFGWIGISDYVRAEFLRNRKQEYVEAARALGASQVRIFFKHILPNSLGPIITFPPFVLAGNITALASLDYLGFGLVPPTPSWGELLSQAHKNFTTSWWLALYPSLFLFMTLVLLGQIGEGVRDALDPRT